MSNTTKKFVSPNKLSVFLDNLKSVFSQIGHKHTLSEISDYTVDTELSAESNNPIANSTVNEEFEAVATAMGVLESAIDDKADAGHTHAISDVTDLQSSLDAINAELDESIKGLSVSGKTITYTKNDGTTGTITTQDTNTDTKVNQAPTTTSNYRPVVLGMTNSTDVSTLATDVTGAVNVTNKIYAQPSAGQLVATTFKGDLDGNAKTATSATSATSATKATQDGNGKVISSTYETKTDASSKLDEAKLYTDNAVATKADSTHNHDAAYDAKGSADTALANAQDYTNTKISLHAADSAEAMDIKISNHNTATDAHNDIRDLINGLSSRLNAIADSDDETLDQLSEIVAYIKANKDLIDSVTTSKVSVSDIIDNLTTNVSNKPLSAAQGVAIKSLIDELQAGLDSHEHEISDVTDLQSTLDGKASKSVATQADNGLMSAEDKIQLDNGGHPIVTTSGTGAAYTATVDGITALTNGMKITIIPHVVSTTTTPTLNVNSLGAKYLRMPVTYNTGASSGGAIAAWLTANKPVTVQYNGTYWLTVDLPKASALYLHGTVPVANGGTGATTAEGALENLGAASASDLSALETEVNTNWANTFSAAETRPANTVLAAPANGGGAAYFRKLTAADLPDSQMKKDEGAIEINTIGWYRIYQATSGTWHGDTVKFSLMHGYSYSATEAYDFSVSVGYSSKVDITQLSGVDYGKSITKIRVVRESTDMWYIDFYYAQNLNNPIYVYGSGHGAFQTPTLVESVPSNAYVTEFDTTTGCKSSNGFTGNLNGNATSASYASYLNTVAGNEIRIRNATGLIGGGQLWLGWDWAGDTDGSNTKDWVIGNFSRGGLANVHANCFIGNLSGNAATATHASNGHYYIQGENNGYYKININAVDRWMLCFTIRVYQGYRATDIMISGYNYGQYYWHDPRAVILGDSYGYGINVYFGYDSMYNLWVGIPADNYTGLDIFNVTNGYVQVSHENLFTITHQSSLTGTMQSTQTIYPPYHQYGSELLLNETSYGTSLPSAGTVGRVFFKKV